MKNQLTPFLLIVLFLLPQIASAQADSYLSYLGGMLNNNARQNGVGRWEGSERGQFLLRIEAAAKKDSTEKATWLQYHALSALKHGDYDVAFTDYETTARLNPKSRGAVGWRYLFLLRDYARALDHLRAFDALTPKFDDPIDDYSVSYLTGRALAGLGRWPEALAAYDVAINSRQQKHGTEWVDYRYFVARAVARLANNQPAEALIDLDNALKNSPKSAMANYHRGRALVQLNRQTEAISAFRDAKFFVLGEPFERDYYYEQPDAAYPEDIDAILKSEMATFRRSGE